MLDTVNDSINFSYICNLHKICATDMALTIMLGA